MVIDIKTRKALAPADIIPIIKDDEHPVTRMQRMVRNFIVDAECLGVDLNTLAHVFQSALNYIQFKLALSMKQ